MKALLVVSGVLLVVACSASPVTYEEPDTAGKSDAEVPWEDVPTPDGLDKDRQDPEMKPLDDATDVAGDTQVADVAGDSAGDSTADSSDQMADDTGNDAEDDAGDDALTDASNDQQDDDVIEDTQPDVVPPEPPVDDLEVKQRPTTQPWESIELLTFAHPALSGEKFTTKTKQNDPTVAGWFDGQNAPGAGTVVLHTGPGCDNAQGVPVMLVHGAGSNANQSFVDPDLLEGGLASKWIEDGRCVFAVTFPHTFGENRNQAVQLAAAMYQARIKSGAPKLHVVAHSKGGIVALAYATGFVAEMGLTYEDDMASLNLIATPMGGMDFTWRHPAFAYPADMMGLYMPSPWYELLQWGLWKDILEDSIYGGAFEGVLQLTVAWDEEYSLAMGEQDWYTTYYGGTGFISKSYGVTEAVSLSGNFMENLRKGKTPATLPCRIASGGLQMVGTVPWEYTGPSDAMVFEASAQDETMLTTVAASEHFALSNHWDLLSSNSLRSWLEEELW